MVVKNIQNVKLFTSIFLGPTIISGVSRWRLYSLSKMFGIENVYVGKKLDYFAQANPRYKDGMPIDVDSI